MFDLLLSFKQDEEEQILYENEKQNLYHLQLS